MLCHAAHCNSAQISGLRTHETFRTSRQQRGVKRSNASTAGSLPCSLSPLVGALEHAPAHGSGTVSQLGALQNPSSPVRPTPFQGPAASAGAQGELPHQHAVQISTSHNSSSAIGAGGGSGGLPERQNCLSFSHPGTGHSTLTTPPARDHTIVSEEADYQTNTAAGISVGHQPHFADFEHPSSSTNVTFAIPAHIGGGGGNADLRIVFSALSSAGSASDAPGSHSAPVTLPDDDNDLPEE